MKEIKIVAVLVIVVAAVALFSGSFTSKEPRAGSVSVASEYQSTTTMAAFSGGFVSPTRLKTGQGVLGSVIITGANTGVVQFLDATTTNITQRNNIATSSLVIAELPASLVAGTYTFDAEFTDGLVVSVFTGLTPTSTVTWR